MNESYLLSPAPTNTNSNSSSPASSMPPSPPLPSVDEVSTIFVVGFPDDMQEREFQNMFIFSKGFEAASLKWHSKDQQDEQDLFSQNNKKQMIGFARFKTRQEAMDAAKDMNGKKVDVERSIVLKAEMAKKNLHIKRNSIVPSLSTSLLPSAVPLPEPFISPMSIISRRLSHKTDTFALPQPNINGYESFLPLPSDLFSPGDYKHDSFLNDSFMISPTQFPFNESIFARSQSMDSSYGSSFSIFSKSSTASEYDTDFTKYQESRKNSHSTFRNNVDHNPPCNTLYVGNLPPVTSEDELRCLFSECEGYKRMCFRQKPQGPMCFVEFEDIIYATQAMNRHQGYTLSNSIKGGIRLSYSKNPLFIKPNKEAEISLGFKQLGTTLLAD